MSPQLLALLWLLAPQTFISGSATASGAVTATSSATPAVTQSDCSTLCPAIWAATEQGEPYELAADSEQIKVGDACRCLSGPGPKLRLDGSEN